jgi:bifunctional DNA-binding transcriptional regulator/antitoxin component of YhaV-PrlF toxin-antitoxin module
MPTFEEVRTVTADGRLVVPWAVQRALGLEHGGPVRFHVENGVVTLIAVDVHKPRADSAERNDVRRKLAEELYTLLAAARDPVEK